MKLWDVLATCLLLLGSVSPTPLYQKLHPAKKSYFSSRASDSLSMSVDDIYPEFQSEDSLQDISIEDQYDIADPDPEQFHDVMDFIEATISRLERSTHHSGGSRARREQRGAANTGGGRRGRVEKRRGRERGRKGGRGERGREQMVVQSHGCLLKEVHLNVTDLGLGYRTKEELIFRYCSGPCVEAETNYDKILNNLTHNKKLNKDTPSRTCCRPIAFDDDLAFLDDNVVYHTLKKHSARKCGCV